MDISMEPTWTRVGPRGRSKVQSPTYDYTIDQQPPCQPINEPSTPRGLRRAGRVRRHQSGGMADTTDVDILFDTPNDCSRDVLYEIALLRVSVNENSEKIDSLTQELRVIQIDSLTRELHLFRQLHSEESSEMVKVISGCVQDIHDQLKSLRLDINRLSAHVHKLPSFTNT